MKAEWEQRSGRILLNVNGGIRASLHVQIGGATSGWCWIPDVTPVSIQPTLKQAKLLACSLVLEDLQQQVLALEELYHETEGEE